MEPLPTVSPLALHTKLSFHVSNKDGRALRADTGRSDAVVQDLEGSVKDSEDRKEVVDERDELGGASDLCG